MSAFIIGMFIVIRERESEKITLSYDDKQKVNDGTMTVTVKTYYNFKG